MKKAKIMLSVIALVAVVSGALAFKANRFIFKPFYKYGIATTVAGGPSVTGCVVPTAILYTTTLNPTTTLFGYSTTTVLANTSTGCSVAVITSPAE